MAPDRPTHKTDYRYFTAIATVKQEKEASPHLVLVLISASHQVMFSKNKLHADCFCRMLRLLWPTSAHLMETTLEALLTRDEMEKRRLEAGQDLMNGLTQSSVARKFGVSRTTASRWNRALQGSGVDALKKRRATGRPSRLTAAQLYGQGAVVHGFSDNRWTTARLAQVIELRFGVRYDHDHVGRLMQKLGLREKRARRDYPAPQLVYREYASEYSPNTALSRPAISPTVA
jgi:putative transposase